MNLCVLLRRALFADTRAAAQLRVHRGEIPPRHFPRARCARPHPSRTPMFHFGAPHTPLFFRSFRCSGQRDHRLLGASLRLAMLPLRAVPRWVVQAAGTASRGLRAFSMFVPGPFGEICLLGLANFTQTNPLGAEVGVRSGFLRRDACFAEHWPPVRLCPKAGRLGAALLAHDGHRETRFESNEGTLESRSTILSQEDRSARTLCAPVGGPVSGPVGRPVGGPVSGPVGARRKKERKEGRTGRNEKSSVVLLCPSYTTVDIIRPLDVYPRHRDASVDTCTGGHIQTQHRYFWRQSHGSKKLWGVFVF